MPRDNQIKLVYIISNLFLGCYSSVVERTLGKGEAESSILSSSTILLYDSAASELPLRLTSTSAKPDFSIGRR